MAIIVNIDVMLAKRKMSVTELTERVGITMANLSILKNGKAKAIRFSTLSAICKALDCQPGDLLEYIPDAGEPEEPGAGGGLE
ncbi:helix-turn-helix domain-containing protein [Paenibacillus piscarius]|uniref:helix-turn-helix domain-containing protein n=1 Tax=Paenibacillus piscarius TaxID=1089681 RepID=UPI001EE90C13|nr:helix-turn-helix transcriptional regulator [Paenibacillus piscarius]